MPEDIEKVGVNKVKVALSAGPEKFEEVVEIAYLKERGRYVVQGFRRGKAPRKFIERLYGENVFFAKARDLIVNEAFYEKARENNLRVIGPPVVSVESLSLEDGLKAYAEACLFPVIDDSYYIGLKYNKSDATVNEEDVISEINKARQKNARLIAVDDRPARLGDIATIDYKGFIYDSPFEGGEAEGFQVKLGSGRLVGEFERQIVGRELGDSFDVFVTFPENYGDDRLNGKPARFETRLKDLTVEDLPELDDEFAQDVSEFSTLAEYKSYLTEKLESEKLRSADDDHRAQTIKALVEAVNPEVPKDTIDKRARELLEELAQNLSRFGLDIDRFIQSRGMTPAELIEEYRRRAEDNVKSSLCVDAVIEAENINISDEDYGVYLKRMAADNRLSEEEYLKQWHNGDKEDFIEAAKRVKALDLLMKHAVAANPAK